MASVSVIPLRDRHNLGALAKHYGLSSAYGTRGAVLAEMFCDEESYLHELCHAVMENLLVPGQTSACLEKKYAYFERSDVTYRKGSLVEIRASAIEIIAVRALRWTFDEYEYIRGTLLVTSEEHGNTVEKLERHIHHAMTSVRIWKHAREVVKLVRTGPPTECS